MPDILTFPANLNSNTATAQLSKEGLVIDSRVIALDYREGYQFQCNIEGTTLTVTRVDKTYWPYPVDFRIYDPSIETVPEFTSKSYRYHGLEKEKAPIDVKEVIVNDSVTVLRWGAFHGCTKMQRCIMGDQVQRIDNYVFFNCKSLKNIRLSRGLRYIGRGTFSHCESIECLFIPPDAEDIQRGVFSDCKRLEILVLPANIKLEQISGRITRDCPKLLTGTVKYEQDVPFPLSKDGQFNHWIKHRYDDLPLIRLCTDPNITAQKIHTFIQHHGVAAFYQTDNDHSLTPLHILTRYNIHVGKDVIASCFDANPAALFTPDTMGKTPLDYLWVDDNDKVDVILHLMQDLCINRRKERVGRSKSGD